MDKAEVQQLLKLGYEIPEIMRELNLTYHQVYRVSQSNVNYALDKDKMIKAIEAGTVDLDDLALVGKCSIWQARDVYYEWAKDQLAKVKKGYNVAQLAAMFNVTEAFVYKHCPTSKYKTTEEEWQKIIRLINNGDITKSEAARRTGASRTTVDRKLRKHMAETSKDPSAGLLRKRKSSGSYVRRTVPRSGL